MSFRISFPKRFWCRQHINEEERNTGPCATISTWEKDPNTQLDQEQPLSELHQSHQSKLQRRDSALTLSPLCHDFKRRLSFTGLLTSCLVLWFSGNSLGYISLFFEDCIARNTQHILSTKQGSKFLPNNPFKRIWWHRTLESCNSLTSENLIDDVGREKHIWNLAGFFFS